MRDDELDRFLSTEQPIVPSANFARNVMDKVRTEAAAPPPIPFPWKRALPGLVLCVAGLVAMCAAAFQRSGPPPLREAPGPSIWTATWAGLATNLAGPLRAANAGGVGWILLAFLLTYVSVKWSLRLAGRRIV